MQFCSSLEKKVRCAPNIITLTEHPWGIVLPMDVVKIVKEIHKDVVQAVPDLNSGGCGIFAYCFARLCALYNIPHEIRTISSHNHFVVKLGVHMFDGYEFVRGEFTKVIHLPEMKDEVDHVD